MRVTHFLFALISALSLAAIAFGAADDETAPVRQTDTASQEAASRPSGDDKPESATECPAKNRSQAVRSKVAALHSALWKSFGEDSGDVDASDFVAAALEAQRDDGVDWDREWGNTIELLREEGDVSDEQWEQYVTHAMSYACAFRQRIQANVPIQVYFHETCDARMGEPFVQPLHIDYTWRVASAELVYDDSQTKPLEVRYYFDSADAVGTAENVYGNRFWQREPFSFCLRFYLRPKSPPTRSLWRTGKARLRFRIDIEYLDDARDRQKIGSRQFKYEQEIEIVGNNTPTVTLTESPSLRERVAQSIRVRHLQEGEGEVSLPFHMSGEAVGLACDVYVRQGTKSWELGSVVSPVESSFGYRYISAHLPDFDATRPTDLVFRPSARLAESSSHLYEIWGEEIVKRNVSINAHE